MTPGLEVLKVSAAPATLPYPGVESGGPPSLRLRPPGLPLTARLKGEALPLSGFRCPGQRKDDSLWNAPTSHPSGHVELPAATAASYNYLQCVIKPHLET